VRCLNGSTDLVNARSRFGASAFRFYVKVAIVPSNLPVLGKIANKRRRFSVSPSFTVEEERAPGAAPPLDFSRPMDELGENLLLAPNEQVCLLFEQHDALKVKEETVHPSHLSLAYDSASSSATSSPSSSSSSPPHHDLSPPSYTSSSPSPEGHGDSQQYLTYFQNHQQSVINVDEDEDEITNCNPNSFLKVTNGTTNDGISMSTDGTEGDKRKRKRVNKVTFVGETNITWEDYIPTDNPVLLFQDNQILYVPRTTIIRKKQSYARLTSLIFTTLIPVMPFIHLQDSHISHCSYYSHSNSYSFLAYSIHYLHTLFINELLNSYIRI
jgi:hypothetical protein